MKTPRNDAVAPNLEELERAPFQVLVLPFRIDGENVVYAILRREPGSGGYWQGIAGGGQWDESPLEAARREALEEAAIDPASDYIQLEARCTIPVTSIAGFQWGLEVLLVPEYSFGVELQRDHDISLSSEHTEFQWTSYERAHELLRWDSNKTALWELHTRLSRRK